MQRGSLSVSNVFVRLINLQELFAFYRIFFRVALRVKDRRRFRGAYIGPYVEPVKFFVAVKRGRRKRVPTFRSINGQSRKWACKGSKIGR